MILFYCCSILLPAGVMWILSRAATACDDRSVCSWSSLTEHWGPCDQDKFVILLYFVDFHLSCPHTHVSVTPLHHHSDNVYVLNENIDNTAEEQTNNLEEEGDVPAEKRKDHSFVSQPQQQEIFLSSARSPFQGNTSSLGLAGSNLSVAINRKRIFSLEPFHQSSIISGRQKREREKQREQEKQEEEENSGTPAKKVKFTNCKLVKVVFQRFYI